MRQIILDTETTGLLTTEGHRLIEIGCVEMINRKLTGKHYHQYINPQREIDEGAIAVHGINNQFLQDKPLFADIKQEFMDFVADAELIIHNAPFDIGFINYELKLLHKKAKPITEFCRVLDTLVLARQLHVGQRNSLDALCKRYSIDNTHRNLHGALLDANLLAQVYLAMTGGQGSLFDETQSSEKTLSEDDVVIVPNVKLRTLQVLKANADELAAHDEHLKAILKKGKCLWLESV